MQKILSIIFLLFSTVSAYPVGKYCTDIWGAKLNITFSKFNSSNITANIFYNKNEKKIRLFDYLLVRRKNMTPVSRAVKAMADARLPPAIAYSILRTTALE